MREFGVPKNTTLEDSPITLRKWFATAWLMTSHWQNISFIQLFRALGKTRKTTWFILSRLRPVTRWTAKSNRMIPALVGKRKTSMLTTDDTTRMGL